MLKYAAIYERMVWTANNKTENGTEDGNKKAGGGVRGMSCEQGVINPPFETENTRASLSVTNEACEIRRTKVTTPILSGESEREGSERWAVRRLVQGQAVGLVVSLGGPLGFLPKALSHKKRGGGNDF